MRTHIVWDWNGTLLNDMAAVVAASNAAFATVGGAPLTVAQYRENYEIPIPRFYQRVLGFQPSGTQWEALDATFQEHYTRLSADVGLADGVPELLAGWAADGHTQSLLSMHQHERLLPAVERFGIGPRFLRVDGRTGPSHGQKAAAMVRHLRALGEAVDPSRTVVIGDAADDALAAREAGVHAVLYTGGSHVRANLEPVGVPVVDSLAEAVALARQLAV
ncbi:HAD family hydrolase [Kitasatospora viridis]|uniref:Phosphoglycolate phosphatase-like HAD superfamily hydrolase n=1 Tax=Kitasatospora viridis TaxID=281105 RepID=A0A561UK73_9ACTN|nr:HAD family hydrolase [Kitasatospora viridis]TWF99736.1 phosphoglycolate phosphatase-like HAD superfamily hydrolase [Kitasatospora viridis]